MADPIRRALEEFEKLPGIGEKSAERIVFSLLARPADDVLRLADAVRDLQSKVRRCRDCQDLTEEDPCGICRDPRREAAQVLVVETPKDLWAIEKTALYRGRYHVLHGRIAPLDGVGPEQLTIDRLKARIRAGGIREVILATNPTAEGDATAAYLGREIPAAGVSVTRIARGLPAGSTLEYASRGVLADALEGRREMGGRPA